jgi:hypothetical protein
MVDLPAVLIVVSFISFVSLDIDSQRGGEYKPAL